MPSREQLQEISFSITPRDEQARRQQFLFKLLFGFMTATLIVPVAIILGVLVVKGGPAFTWEFLFEFPRDRGTAGGILPALVGTLWLVGVALAASIPLGVAAAVYLSEYARDNWLTRAINMCIINLAGVPSIVHALFGVGAFVLFFEFGSSILSAGLTLAVMTLPVVIVSTRESLQAVPQAFREACWNMGATRWQTIRHVVLPNSISGILTGVILEVSRTVGETAPIMFTGAVTYLTYLPQGVQDQTMALSLHLYVHLHSGQRPARGSALRGGAVVDRHRHHPQLRLDRVPVLSAQQEEVVMVANKLEIRNLSVRYGAHEALRGVSLEVRQNEIFGIIGPANSGKTSFLRCLNRMDEQTPGMQVSGKVMFDGKDVRAWRNIYALRSRIGVVFPLPVGLPMTVYENVSLSPRLRGLRKKADLDEIVERCLRRAALWDEVKDRLDSLGSLLSGGQQQRLTIARALSQEPQLLLLDEFSIAVDPVTTMRIEDVLKELKAEMTIVLVTNLVQQARRLADRTAFFLKGECVEIDVTENLFTGSTKDQRTRDYVEGRFG